jgi:hypothetical protein
MKSFADKIVPVAIASIICGIAVAGGDKTDHMKMMDANGDGKVTATEHADCANKMFTKMDTNKDARVTAAEMDAAQPYMKSHQDKSGSTTTRNEDGHDKENAADKSHHAAAKDRGGKMMSSSEKIAVIDTDGDGQLTAAEHSTGAKKMFTKMDTDSDGTLTAQELREGHRSMMTASDQ